MIGSLTVRAFLGAGLQSKHAPRKALYDVDEQRRLQLRLSAVACWYLSGEQIRPAVALFKKRNPGLRPMNCARFINTWVAALAKRFSLATPTSTGRPVSLLREEATRAVEILWRGYVSEGKRRYYTICLYHQVQRLYHNVHWLLCHLQQSVLLHAAAAWAHHPLNHLHCCPLQCTATPATAAMPTAPKCRASLLHCCLCLYLGDADTAVKLIVGLLCAVPPAGRCMLATICVHIPVQLHEWRQTLSWPALCPPLPADCQGRACKGVHSRGVGVCHSLLQGCGGKGDAGQDLAGGSGAAPAVVVL